MPESPLPAVPVTLGARRQVQAVLPQGSVLLLEKNHTNALTQSLTLSEAVEAPVEQGDTLGSLDLFAADGTLLSSLPLLAGESVARLTWRQLFCRCASFALCIR